MTQTSSTFSVYISPNHEVPTCNPNLPPNTNYYGYVITDGQQKFITGFKHIVYNELMHKKDLEKIDFDSFLTWKQIPFSQICHICQLDLVNKMGNLFPWNESEWKSKDTFYEKHHAITVNAKLSKSLIFPQFFVNYFYKTDEWEIAIENEWYYKTSSNGYGPINETLVEIGGHYYLVKDGVDKYKDPWANIILLSLKDATRILEEIKNHELAKFSLYHQYGKKCRALSKKYGIRFDVALFYFKGNEKNIEAFVSSLKEASKRPYKATELRGSSKRRRNEIQRLGIKIGNINPDYITPYILECLKAKQIVK